MAWFRRRQPPRASATELADILYRLIVEEHQQLDDPAHYNVPEPLWSAYRGKMRIYREALVLLILIHRAEQQSAYGPLVIAFRALIFPPEPNDLAAAKWEFIRRAMDNLLALLALSSDPKLVWSNTWSKEWLAEIGHDVEDDPLAFMEFSLNWTKSMALLGDAVDALELN